MSLDGSSGMAFEGDGLGHHERRFSPRKTCFTSGVIFKRDTGAGFDLPDERRDGTPNCAYGDFEVESAGVGCTETDPDEAV